MSLGQEFQTEGYAVARGLFSSAEVAEFTAHYEAMRLRGGDGWAEGGVDLAAEEPLKRYPRLLQPHRGDELSMRFMLDARLRSAFEEMLGAEPFGVQTMVYFKPPGARGQALHQDQRYLEVQPGTCIAAWLALDDCDDENGCLQVVPGSQNLPILCPVKSDTAVSFTTETVPVPPGLTPVPVHLKAGDVLFFNGELIHGSGPNRSATRFRRSLIGHYIVAEAQQVAKYYFPVYRFDGSQVEIEVSSGGGKCGTLHEDGTISLGDTIDGALAAH